MEYEFISEPTPEQVKAYERVRYYYVQKQVAEWLEMNAPIPLEQHEFNKVVYFAYRSRMDKPGDGDFISSLYLSELRDRK